MTSNKTVQAKVVVDTMHTGAKEVGKGEGKGKKTVAEAKD